MSPAPARRPRAAAGPTPLAHAELSVLLTIVNRRLGQLERRARLRADAANAGPCQRDVARLAALERHLEPLFRAAASGAPRPPDDAPRIPPP